MCLDWSLSCRCRMGDAEQTHEPDDDLSEEDAIAKAIEMSMTGKKPWGDPVVLILLWSYSTGMSIANVLLDKWNSLVPIPTWSERQDTTSSITASVFTCWLFQVIKGLIHTEGANACYGVAGNVDCYAGKKILHPEQFEIQNQGKLMAVSWVWEVLLSHIFLVLGTVC